MTGTAFLQDPLVYAIEHYTDMVLRLAAHYAPNLSDAEDVVQDVFEKLMRFEKGFESVAVFKRRKCELVSIRKLLALE